jgi:ATP-dependent Lon protease
LEVAAKKAQEYVLKKKGVSVEVPENAIKMYTLKFNSPILPYAKFPLTQNKYIQDFLRGYEEDKTQIEKVLGVHFEKNSNMNASDAVGIEIEIIKKNNVAVIESVSDRRYRVVDYDSVSNFCKAVPYEDEDSIPLLKDPNEDDQRYKDLLMSEVFELKNTWFLYNKKINSVLVILPQEILNRYDMVAKSLQPPVFDMAKYPEEARFIDIFNEITYKMAQYYFSVFQALFSKDNESVRPMIRDFLRIQDPIHRSRKIINFFEELHGIIDKKLYYVQKMADEFKERSKTSLLEHAFQRVLEDSKKTDKVKFQEKLDEVKGIDDATRKVLQEEIDSLDSKNDTENSRKVQYLNQVFRLPWDKQVDPFWDVKYSRQVLENSHYGMHDTKERILEFIAKNKRINSQTGMVLLLTGPPGVGKTSIAKSIGDCLKRPTTVISMGG